MVISQTKIFPPLQKATLKIPLKQERSRLCTSLYFLIGFQHYQMFLIWVRFQYVVLCNVLGGSEVLIRSAPHLDRNHRIFLTQHAKTDVGLGGSRWGLFHKYLSKKGFLSLRCVFCTGYCITSFVMGSQAVG